MTDAGPLVLGPVLRRVAATLATIWVQTANAATVRVSAGSATGEATTFCVSGLHFALVVVDGLPPGATTPYEVSIDDVPVWPPADYGYPAPAIRTRGDTGDPVHVVFGSCRESTPRHVRGLDPDALDAYAVRLATGDPAGAPDLLMLVGDQIYADITSTSTRDWLRRRRPRRAPEAPPKQVVDFTEYARLYRESWTDPDVRWLLSTVSSVMIFDDHEIIDDWNTSASWRRDMQKVPWWSERITAGLASYWVFQHAGNLDPAALADDPVYRLVRGGGDPTGALHAFAAAADADADPRHEDEPRTYQWSYSLDIGRTRIVVLDNRGGRVLTRGRRSMLSAPEWSWFVRTVTGDAADYDHLAIGSSLPWLMPFGIHDVEAASERWADSRVRAVAAFGEWLRRTLDLEHWPAFGASFDNLAAVLAAIGASGPRAAAYLIEAASPVSEARLVASAAERPPASISVLSGDVHHSYVARAAYRADVVTPVYQLTCSPIHNRVPAALRPLMRASWRRRGRRIGRILARRAGAVRPLVSWRRLSGPYFGNAIATLRYDGAGAVIAFEVTAADGTLRPVAEIRLA